MNLIILIIVVIVVVGIIIYLLRGKLFKGAGPTSTPPSSSIPPEGPTM